MMNKYFIVIGIIVLILLGGGIYRSRFLAKEFAPVTTGVERRITIVAAKNEWRFEPEVIEADKGDKIIATVINEDNYDHGIAIDAFGIAQRMPANGTVTMTFVVTQDGDFPFYCSVPCGEGIVDGELRDHFDMIGKLHVRSIISGTQ